MHTAASLLDNIVSISSFGRGQSAKIFAKAQRNPVIVTKHNVPEAVILEVGEYKRLSELEEDNILLTEALARLKNDREKPMNPHEEIHAISETARKEVREPEELGFEQ